MKKAGKKTFNLAHENGKAKIEFKRGLLEEAFNIEKVFGENKRFLVVANGRIKRLYGKKIIESIRSKKGYSGEFIIPDSEQAKDIGVALKLYEKLISARFDRYSVLVAVGGGATTDLTGFVASTFARGIPWIAIPTTLCGQVDASIGGKTGINLKQGKNLVGTFWHPRLTLIDPAVLDTLSKKEWISGIAEVIKYGIIADPWIFNRLEKEHEKVLLKNPGIVDPLIARCIKTKITIVEQDQKDSGIRNILNFGHTLGHALETLENYKAVTHGQGVAAGMLFATNLAKKLGICDKKLFHRIDTLIREFGLYRKVRIDDKKVLIDIMKRDKKHIGNNIRFVLPVEMGKVVLKDIPVRMLEKDTFWRFDKR